MEPRRLLMWFVVLASLTLVSAVLVDRPLAGALDASAAGAQTLTAPVMHAIEVAFGFPVSKFLTGAVLLCAAAALFPMRRFRSAAWVLTLLALAQLTTRLLAGVLKNVFLRPRPHEPWMEDRGSSSPAAAAFRAGTPRISGRSFSWRSWRFRAGAFRC